jgi:hypothetical protein
VHALSLRFSSAGAPELTAMAAAPPRCSWPPRALRAYVKFPLVARRLCTDGIDAGSPKSSARSPSPELCSTVVADDWLDSGLSRHLQTPHPSSEVTREV